MEYFEHKNKCIFIYRFLSPLSRYSTKFEVQSRGSSYVLYRPRVGELRNWHREPIVQLSSESSRTGFKVSCQGSESSGNQVRSTLGDDNSELASGSINQPPVCASGAKAFAERRVDGVRRSLVSLRGRTSARTESALSGCVCALTRNTLQLALTGRGYKERESARPSARSLFFLLRYFARVSPCPPFCLPLKSPRFLSRPLAVHTYLYTLLWLDDARGNARFRETPSNTERIVSTPPLVNDDWTERFEKIAARRVAFVQIISWFTFFRRLDFWSWRTRTYVF